MWAPPPKNGLYSSTAKKNKQEIPSYFQMKSWPNVLPDIHVLLPTTSSFRCQRHTFCFFLAAMPRSETHRGFHSKQGLGCKGKKDRQHHWYPGSPSKNLTKLTSHISVVLFDVREWCFFFWDFKLLFENSGIQELPWNISGMCIFWKGSRMELLNLSK